jgi:hypothetical protein
MEMKWSFYVAAVIFVGYFLLAGGVPPVAVAMGIGAAGLWTLWQRRRGNSHSR